MNGVTGDTPKLPPSVPHVQWFANGAWWTVRHTDWWEHAGLRAFVQDMASEPHGREGRMKIGNLQYRCVYSQTDGDNLIPAETVPRVFPDCPPAGPEETEKKKQQIRDQWEELNMGINPGTVAAMPLSPPEPPRFAFPFSLRDWFAGQALPQMIDIVNRTAPVGMGPAEVLNRTALRCYQIADAMVAAMVAASKEEEKPDIIEVTRLEVVDGRAMWRLVYSAEYGHLPQLERVIKARIHGIPFVIEGTQYLITKIA